MFLFYSKVFFTGFILSLFFTPLVRRFALKYNFIAKPKKDRWNKRIIPICGGVAIYLSFLISYFIYTRNNILFMPLVGGATAAFLCGFIDDIFSIKPYSKLFVQIIISAFMCLCGIRFNILPIAFLNIFLTIFWFVTVMNAFNLLDNMDGLCAGITVISAGLIFAYYGFASGSNVSILALLIAASALGFLRYNFHPAKIFMGDCGSMLIGFILAATTVIGTWKGMSNFLVTLVVPVLVLGVPVFDTILVTFARQAHGRHFYEGGKDHTSHRLVVLGMSETRAVLTMYFMSFGCGLVAFMYTKLNVAAMIILMMFMILLLVFFGIFLNQVKIYASDDESKKTSTNNKVFLSGMIYHKQNMFEMIIDLLVISASFIGACLLRYEGVLSPFNLELIVMALPILIITKLSCFYWFGLYKGVWQYIGLHDLFNIFKAVTFGSMSSIVALAFMFNLKGYSRAVFIIDWLILLIAVSVVRFAMRLFREYFNFSSANAKNILIMGAGDAGEYFLRGIKYNKKLNYAVVGFLDDDTNKHGRKIHGVEILGTSKDMVSLAKKYKVSEILVAIPSIDNALFNNIMEICQKNDIVCKKMSELELW